MKMLYILNFAKDSERGVGRILLSSLAFSNLH